MNLRTRSVDSPQPSGGHVLGRARRGWATNIGVPSAGAEVRCGVTREEQLAVEDGHRRLHNRRNPSKHTTRAPRWPSRGAQLVLTVIPRACLGNQGTGRGGVVGVGGVIDGADRLTGPKRQALEQRLFTFSTCGATRRFRFAASWTDRPNADEGGMYEVLRVAESRAVDPGSAERRHHGGRRLGVVGSSGARQEPELVENVKKLADRARALGVPVDPRPLHRRDRARRV